MTITMHRLPAGTFTALAAGGGGAAAIALLRDVQYSKHVLLLRGVAGHCPEGWDLLAAAQRYDQAATREVVRHPSAGAWAHRTVLAVRGGPVPSGTIPEQLAGVAAAAAVRGGLRAEIKVPVLGGLVVLPSLGVASIDGAAMTVTVRTGPRGARVETMGAPVVIPADWRKPALGWRPLRCVLADPAAGVEVDVDDADPFRMPATPRLARVPDLSGWQPAFAGAWDLLRRHHPDLAAEVAGLARVAVPLARPAHGQVSSSSPETFGAVAMSEPVDARSLAVTLTHEVQHMKLSAALDVVPLTRPDDGSRYYAPWREDPRPASGLLQGAYAYLGVTRFWRQQRVIDQDPVAQSEFARWREAAAQVCRVLLHSGQLTEQGARFAAVMAQTLRMWQAEPVPLQPRLAAAQLAEQHRTRWQSANGPIPPPP